MFTAISPPLGVPLAEMTRILISVVSSHTASHPVGVAATWTFSLLVPVLSVLSVPSPEPPSAEGSYVSPTIVPAFTFCQATKRMSLGPAAIDGEPCGPDVVLLIVWVPPTSARELSKAWIEMTGLPVTDVSANA